MPNYNPNQTGLKSFPSKWESGKTKAYKLPEAIAPQVLELAHKIDQGITVTSDIEVLKEVNEILDYACTLPANKGGAIKVQIRKAQQKINSYLSR